jgi:hypothetical protein
MKNIPGRRKMDRKALRKAQDENNAAMQMFINRKFLYLHEK